MLYARAVRGGWNLYRARSCEPPIVAFIADNLPWPLGNHIHLTEGDPLTDPRVRLERYDVEHVE